MERVECTGCSQNCDEMAALTSCRLESFSGMRGIAAAGAAHITQGLRLGAMRHQSLLHH